MLNKITCRNCKWTTNSKHFGFIQTKENIKKFGANHLCLVCYLNYATVTQEEVVKHYSKLQAEDEYGW